MARLFKNKKAHFVAVFIIFIIIFGWAFSKHTFLFEKIDNALARTQRALPPVTPGLSIPRLLPTDVADLST